MLTDYERHLIACYLVNAASRFHYHDREAVNLAEWVTDSDNLMTFESGRRRSRVRRANIKACDGLSAQQWRRLGETLRSEYSATKQARPDRTARRLRRLGKTTGLSRTDADILELILRYQTQPNVESMIDAVFNCTTRRSSALNLKGLVLPVLLGKSANTILGRFRPDAPLVRSGLVSIDGDGDLTVVNRLHRLTTAPGGDNLDVNRLLLGATSPGELEWSDFDHLARDRDHIEKLLKGALQTGEPGVNILLYGPPGTGKTQFCKALAEQLGVDLYSVGESDEDGDEPNRGERLQELRLAQRLLARDRKSLLLFDEMEDLLLDSFSSLQALFGSSSGSGRRSGGSKVFMNRLLEQTPAPTLWAMNDAEQVSDVILRRMMFALELRLPPPGVRARIWARQLTRHGIEASPDETLSLAREFDATPGVAAGVTAAARLADGDIATVRRGVRSLSRVLSCEKPPQEMPDHRFNPALIQADTDPVRLANRLVQSGERRFSLCLQGPPGTGKSAFARYLADRLGLEVMHKRASDLISCWVGETERQIARMFAEAHDTDSFLVFDEADSLLANRRFAKQTWEVTQVNEMLTWMESHPLPFACTTNFGEHLDTATLRRFTFKITLDFLTPEQVTTAFRGYFALTPPAGTAGLTTLTPGDFAVVRRQAGILDRLQDPEALAAMLHAECDAKPGRRRAIGFQP